MKKEFKKLNIALLNKKIKINKKKLIKNTFQRFI